MGFGGVIRSRIKKVQVVSAQAATNPFGPFDQLLYTPDLLGGGLVHTRGSSARFVNDISDVRFAFYTPEESVDGFTRSSTARFVNLGPEP